MALHVIETPITDQGPLLDKAGRITHVQLDTWGGWWRDGGEFTTYGSFTQEVK